MATIPELETINNADPEVAPQSYIFHEEHFMRVEATIKSANDIVYATRWFAKAYGLQPAYLMQMVHDFIHYVIDAPPNWVGECVADALTQAITITDDFVVQWDIVTAQEAISAAILACKVAGKGKHRIYFESYEVLRVVNYLNKVSKEYCLFDLVEYRD